MDGPAANWIEVGQLAEAFAPDANALRRSDALAGTAATLHFADGTVVRYDFLNAERLRWRRSGGGEAETGGEAAYLATSLRPDIHFVDICVADPVLRRSVSLVLDRAVGVATAVVGTLPDPVRAHGGLLARARRQEELTAVDCRIAVASVNTPFDAAAPHHRATDELVGMRVRHRYSPTELYEHIYLNEARYTWHCLEGAEVGLADTERCHYLRIAEEFYLFVWREKVVPTLGVVMLDLAALKTTGKIFGYQDEAMTALSNFPVGARSTILHRRLDGA